MFTITNQTKKITLMLSIGILLFCIGLPSIFASPITNQNVNDDEVVVPLDGTTLKSILLYNRLNQLVQNEPEVLDLLDLDRGHLSRIVDELLNQSNQIRSKKFLNVKSSKRAAAMGVDLPDYILHINKGRNFDFSSFREKMQKSG